MNSISGSSKSNKFAVIFHGIVSGDSGRNGLGNLINLEHCAQLIKHNLLQDLDYDIFVHSWSPVAAEQIISLYNPVSSLFEEQETFNYNFSEEDFLDENKTHGFRTVSRYESLHKAIQLKNEYSKAYGINYDWVLVLRFDLVVLNKINFDNLNKEYFYVCSEPHWQNIHDVQMIHDIIFVSSEDLMNSFGEIAIDIRNGKYADILPQTHKLAYKKLSEILSDVQCIQFICNRFEDMDIYRLVTNPDLNELGKQYGGLTTSARMQKLLLELEDLNKSLEEKDMERTDTFFLENLVKFVDAKVVLEIGVQFGNMALHLCRAAESNNGTYHGFDLWDNHGLVGQFNNFTGSIETVKQKLTNHGLSKFTLTKVNTFDREAFNQILDNLGILSIDFALIDACHSYFGVANDFSLIYPRLSPKGIIAFHDTAKIDGCREFNLDLRTKYNDGTFDIVDFPFGEGSRFCGVSLLVKRSYSTENIAIDEVCGSLSEPDVIEQKELIWYLSQQKQPENIILNKESMLLHNIGFRGGRNKFEKFL